MMMLFHLTEMCSDIPRQKIQHKAHIFSSLPTNVRITLN